jgi:DNA/RNA endonuclease YhcR with UshA esterase domain
MLLIVLLIEPVQAQKKLTASEAKTHIGETVTVCGNVVSTRYAASTKGQPTFLNLDKPYPNQIFTVLIWGSDRAKFGKPEADYQDKRICVTGKVAEYRGVPEIVAPDPQQISKE